MSKVLDVVCLEKIYGTAKKNGTRAVNNVSFQVESGEFVAVMGPSGSGKSTLMNCISTLDRPTSGEVYIDGHALSTMKSREVSSFRSKNLGFIFQDASLLDTLTCRENIALPLAISSKNTALIDGIVQQYACELGIESILDSYPYEVSGGQAQRVAVCRALVTNPTFVVADEPTGALDSRNSKILLENFSQLNDKHQVTILMVTHDIYAASWCKRVLFLRDGKLYSELIRGHKTQQQFFEEIMSVMSVIGGGVNDVI